MPDNIKIKIDSSLNFIENMLSGSGLQNYRITDTDPDIIISEAIPINLKPFIVIWEKHDVDEIDKLISDHKNSRCVYGFFLKQDAERDAAALIKTLSEMFEHINSVNMFKDKARIIIDRKEFFEIGSLVKISKKSGSKLELEYGNPRFTTLFIDKPMIELVNRINKILHEIEPQIDKLSNHYKGYIEQVAKNDGIIPTSKEKQKQGVATTFDNDLVQNLYNSMNSNPVKLDPILFTGDTGVGKTLLARWIHDRLYYLIHKKNKRDAKTFQEINSSALSGNLIESELFGHVEGAWTDAKITKAGKALLALGGVLFLDEIGDMPLDIQTRLLKFIEEKTFTPEGWSGLPFYTPLLVIGATNKNLDEEVEKGKFRTDFYARFKHRVHVPSIEDRKQSLNAIIDLILQNPFINPIINRDERLIKYVSYEAFAKFKNIAYPENFRGLEGIVRDAANKTRDYGLDVILAEAIET